MNVDLKALAGPRDRLMADGFEELTLVVDAAATAQRRADLLAARGA
jgi:hypothetical protein